MSVSKFMVMAGIILASTSLSACSSSNPCAGGTQCVAEAQIVPNADPRVGKVLLKHKVVKFNHDEWTYQQCLGDALRTWTTDFENSDKSSDYHPDVTSQYDSRCRV